MARCPICHHTRIPRGPVMWRKTKYEPCPHNGQPWHTLANIDAEMLKSGFDFDGCCDPGHKGFDDMLARPLNATYLAMDALIMQAEKAQKRTWHPGDKYQNSRKMESVTSV